jgi:dTDP-4-dehydrorhamnose reductase
VGRETLPLLAALGDVVSVTRAELDLTDTAAIRSVVRQVRPRWIVNAAAYTAVDKAEQDANLAFAINGEAPGIVGEEARRVGAPVIHFSTDYVFSGQGTLPWQEDDPTGPLGVYGASKLAGEQALAHSGAAHIIFRTSWVFGAQGENFLLKILKLAAQREELKVVDDQVGSPTWSRTLGLLVGHTIVRVEEAARTLEVLPDQAVRPLAGIYHACSKGFTTWFGFASELVRLAQQAHPERTLARVLPVPSSEYPTAAVRPMNSRMSGEKLARSLEFEMPAWQDSTSKVIAEVLSNQRR